MCKLEEYLNNEKERYGYKVVAKKGNKYYSLAMGFCYNDHKNIPEIKVQKRLSTQFSDDILKHNSYGFEPNMIGRTAIFQYLYDARKVYREACCYVRDGYEVVIVLAVVSVDLMSGSYGIDRVIGGKKIKFYGEIPASKM